MPARLLAALVLLWAAMLSVVSLTSVSHDPVVSRRVPEKLAAVTTTSSTSTTVTTLPPTTTLQRASRAATRPRVVVRRVAVDEATKQRVIAAIYSYGDWDADRMLRIAMCESGLNPWAVNGKHHGIFQIANSTLGLIEEHVALAHSIWQRRGYQPWECKG